MVCISSYIRRVAATTAGIDPTIEFITKSHYGGDPLVYVKKDLSG